MRVLGSELQDQHQGVTIGLSPRRVRPAARLSAGSKETAFTAMVRATPDLLGATSPQTRLKSTVVLTARPPHQTCGRLELRRAP